MSWASTAVLLCYQDACSSSVSLGDLINWLPPYTAYTAPCRRTSRGKKNNNVDAIGIRSLSRVMCQQNMLLCWCLPDSPKPDSPKLGFRVRVRVGVSANRVLAKRDWTTLLNWKRARVLSIQAHKPSEPITKPPRHRFRYFTGVNRCAADFGRSFSVLFSTYGSYRLLVYGRDIQQQNDAMSERQ